LPAGSGIALIERGACPFQQKLDNIEAAGYDAGIVFNAMVADCTFLVTMLAEGDLPFLFVQRETGLKLLGIDSSGSAACTNGPTRGIAQRGRLDRGGIRRLGLRTPVPDEDPCRTRNRRLDQPDRHLHDSGGSGPGSRDRQR
jgi:hypothetical protein